MILNTRGLEWHKWDLYLYTVSSCESAYQTEDADGLLCQVLKNIEISPVTITGHYKIDLQ